MKKQSLCLLFCLLFILCGMMTACSADITYFNITVPSETEGYTISPENALVIGNNQDIYSAEANSDWVFNVLLETGYDIDSVHVLANGVELTGTQNSDTVNSIKYCIENVDKDFSLEISVSLETRHLEVAFGNEFMDKYSLDNSTVEFLRTVSLINIYRYDLATGVTGANIFSISAKNLFNTQVNKNISGLLHGDIILIELVAVADADLFAHTAYTTYYEHSVLDGNNNQMINTEWCFVQRTLSGEKVVAQTNPGGAQIILVANFDGTIDFANYPNDIYNQENISVQNNTVSASISRIGGDEYSATSPSEFSCCSFSDFLWLPSQGNYCFNVNSNPLIPEDIEGIAVFVNGQELAKTPGELAYIPKDDYTGAVGTESYDYCIPLSTLLSGAKIEISFEVRFIQVNTEHYMFDIETSNFSDDLNNNVDITYYNLFCGSNLQNAMIISPEVNSETFCEHSSFSARIELSKGFFVADTNLDSFVALLRWDNAVHAYVVLTSGFNVEYVNDGNNSDIVVSVNSDQITGDMRIALNGNVVQRETFNATLPVSENDTVYFLNSSSAWVEVTEANKTITLDYDEEVILKIVPGDATERWFVFSFSDDENESLFVDYFSLGTIYAMNSVSSSDGNYYFYIAPARANYVATLSTN
ncbi:MAG: hypothetical protein PHE93_05345 [Clostridia bacterium]|nr:hypothetical protein [Clostridia bacterium]